MIDLHCHLDLFDDPYELVNEIDRRRCYVLAVTTTPLAWTGTNRVVGDCPRVRVALGLHPELVGERHRELRQFEELLPEAKYVGEIGLDGSSRHRSSFDQQKRVFREILRLATYSGGRLMSIHSRAAATPVLDELERRPGAGTAVLHWFSGTLAELQRAVELDCWFSVGPAMLGTAQGRKLLNSMPRERLITESDGPFAQEHGHPVLPWQLGSAIRAIGEAWGESNSSVQRQLLRNLRVLVETAT